MARELHTLNEVETELVNEFVEGGIAETAEEALQLLIDAGEIADTESKGTSYIPEGFEFLKFSSGNSMNPFTIINEEAEEAGLDNKFKKGHYYYGVKTPKKEDKSYDFDNFNWGEDVGASPKLVITHILYNGSRFPINNDKVKLDGVTSTYEVGMNFSHQKGMIDITSKKSIYALRQEQIKEQGVSKYADVEPKEAKIKFKTTVFGLVEVNGEWKPFILIEDQKFEEKDFLYEFNKDTKGKIKSKILATIRLENAKTESGVRYYMKHLIVDRDIEPSEYKETFSKLAMNNMKAVSKFLADQKESINKSISNSSSTPNKESSEDEVEDENIDWD